jgi:serine/threonine-protein kinase
MEYIKGVPLTEYCRQQASTIEQRLKLFASVCEAVRYAYSRAIIHRDLKPANILVQSDGSLTSATNLPTRRSQDYVS